MGKSGLASVKILVLILVGFAILPSASWTSETESTTDRLSFVAPRPSLPWYEQEESHGSFVYHYPLTLPPGRNQMEPRLELRYSSADREAESLVAAGWSLPVPFIQRVNKTGVEDLYQSTLFYSSLSGELLPVILTDESHGTYGAKVENGPFWSYTYTSDEQWIVVDPKGVRYTFAASSDACVVDPNDPSHVFRWMIEEIRDTHDNRVVFSYAKDGNQVYPSRIDYSTHGSEAGIFTVQFDYESRNDAITSYKSGFAVTTAWRLASVTVAASHTTVRTYTFNYETGDNGTRSLLAAIEETAYDMGGTALTLPKTRFGYSGSTVSWTQDSAYHIPQNFVENEGYDRGVRFSDVNGDGLQDILFADSGNYPTTVYLNRGDGTGWTQDTSYTIPVRFLDVIVAADQGARLADVDGDGLDDIVYGESDDIYDGDSYDTREVYINKADGSGWSKDSAYVLPQNFIKNAAPYAMYDNYLRLGDVNGDGLLDLLYSDPYGGDAVYLHNADGSGWTQAAGYKNIPVNFGQTFGGDVRDSGGRVADVNHDGLADLVYGLTDAGYRYPGAGVYVNKGDGTGWVFDSNYLLPVDFSYGGYDSGARLSDVNADGFVDIVIGDDMNGYNAIYLNTADGKGWTQVDGTLPLLFTGYNLNGHPYDKGVRIVDVDGDGLEDLAYADGSGGSGGQAVYIHDGQIPDLLIEITSSQGAEIAISYSSSLHDGVHPNLPFIVQVLDHIVVDDGLGHAATTSYVYKDGDFYYADETDRQFAGFGKVAETNALGNVTVKYFHQGNATNAAAGEVEDRIAKLGKLYREETYDNTGGLYRVRILNWQASDLGDQRSFVYLEDEIELLYDADTDHTDKATHYAYDSATGNPTKELRYGAVAGNNDGSYTDTGSDAMTTVFAYAMDSSGANLINYVSEERWMDQSGARVKETLFQYDALPQGEVAVGNLSSEHVWISASDYAETSYTYNAYGLITTVTDPRGNTLSYSYDPYYLYPATVTDPLTFQESFTYDYATGKPTRKIDKNGNTWEWRYDGFGRAIEERVPDPSAASSSPVVKTTWKYSDAAIPTSIYESRFLDDASTVDVYTHLDGLGRVVQVRTETEEGTYSVVDTVYNEIGLVEALSLPYESSFSDYTNPTTDDTLLTFLSYDPLLRVTNESNAVGNTAHRFEAWEETVQDPNGKLKVYRYDAHGRLSAVVETVSLTNYTTTYTYTAADHLATYTDALGNLRRFSYDGRGKRLTAEDLHAATDTSYGAWAYTFDKAGNLETRRDPNGNTITSTYDELNRPERTDDALTISSDTSYTYDNCTNGKGKLCSSVIGPDVSVSYSYDALGNRASEKKTIKGKVHTTSYIYDRQGNLTKLIYPDNSYAAYGYNSAGLLESVVFYDAKSASTSTLVTDIDYTPHFRPETIVYGSGSVSTLGYDATDLYRLSSKVTTSALSTTLQNFTYTYDNVGNITAVADASALYSPISYTYSYDDLYRLIQGKAVQGTTTLYDYTYYYDAIGNFTSASGAGKMSYGGATTSGSMANPHAPTKVGSYAYSYDNNGNLTFDGSWQNGWTFKNEIAATNCVTSSCSTLAYSFLYDHNGERVYKAKTVSGSASTKTYYPSAAYDVEGSYYKRHIAHPTLGNIATNLYSSSKKISTLVYHHSDHLGGMHVDTDPSGVYLEYILYYPFGRVYKDIRSSSAVVYNDFKFIGKERDDSTNRLYLGARYYQPKVSKFLSQDPVFLSLGASEDKQAEQMFLRDPQLWNSYGYARNNPVVGTDSSGKFLDTFVDAIFIAYDISVLVRDEIRTGGANRTENLAALGADAIGAVTPFATGLGAVVRTGMKADKVIGLVQTTEKTIDAAKDFTKSAEKASTLKPGPFAKESIPGHMGKPTAIERQQVNTLMEKHGCHTCSIKDPGTKSGNAIVDHQPPQALDETRDFYPHCIDCSRRQGGEVLQQLMNRDL